MLRLCSGLFALTFLASAAVQLNDPDPARWVLVYLMAAGFSCWHVAGRQTDRRWLTAFAACVTAWIVWIGLTTTDVGVPMDHGPGGFLAYEVIREGLGLAIVLAGMLVVGLAPVFQKPLGQ
jgi:hypothetical protein